MGKIKKVLCMLLVCTVIIAPCSLLGNVFAQTGNSVPLTVEVSTDKSSYTAYGIAEITVNVTNTSNETVNNISAEAVFNDLSPVGKNNETFKEIESLKSGESFSFSYKATVNASNVKLNFFEKIILWFVRLFNGGYTAKGNNYDDNREYISRTNVIDFGNASANNEIIVRYGFKTQNSGLSYEDASEMNLVDKSITDLMNSNDYKKLDGNELKVEILMQKLEQLEKEGLIEKNSIKYYEKSNQITFNYFNGIPSGILIDSKSNSITNDELFDVIGPVSSINTESVSLKSVQNSNNRLNGITMYGYDNSTNENSYYNEWDNIIREISRLGMTTSIYDKSSVDDYKTAFIGNDFICIFEHGTYLEGYNTCSFVVAGENASEELDVKYGEDINENRIYRLLNDGIAQYFITPKFFSHYYGNNRLEDSLVFLLSCQSFGAYGKMNYGFAEAFYNDCGSNTIIGFHNSVLQIYGTAIFKDFTTNMLCGYTAQESLNMCTEKYGMWDINYLEQYILNMNPVPREYIEKYENLLAEGNHAFPCLFGDENKVLNKQSGTVSGTVKDETTGNTIYGVTVEVIANSSDSFDPVIITTTDENGQFSINLPYGDYSISFNHDNYEYYGIGVNVDRENSVLTEHVLLTRKLSILLGTVSGTVKDETTGNIISGVNVEVIDNLVDGFDPVITTITDENGLFSVNLPYGIYSLSFSHDNYEYNGTTVNVDTENVVLTEPVLLTPKDSSGDNENIEFAGGNGTEENPYQVSTPEQLDKVRNYLDCHFIQTADIDLAEWGNWEPIGKVVTKYSTANGTPLKLEEYYFTGSYNGNGFSINNLNINDSDISPHYDSFGLFAGINNATIININLINANIHINKSTTDYEQIWLDEKRVYSVCVGGIVGICYGDKSLISGCVISGEINVTDCNNAYVGGITGFGNPLNSKNYADIYVLATRYSRNEHEDSIVHCGGITGHSQTVNSKISKCENHGSISATGGIFVYVGGITGIYGQISDCINYGNISGVFVHYGATSTSFLNCCVGGINGANTSDYIKNCINYGNISAYDFSDNNEYYSQSGYGVTAGGISGDSTGGNEIISCYNLCNSINAKQERSRVGRIAGSSSKITNCYSSKDTLVNDEIIVSSLHTTDSISKNINGGDLSKEEFLKEESYIGFDFKNTWKIDPEIGGAVLQ